jgi:hypothetical protein
MKRWLAIITMGIMALAILCCRAATATAAEQLVFDVPPEGGIYEIPVHSRHLTVLYFPSPVTSFVHGQSHAVKVEQRQHILTVELGAAATVTSMSVECARFRVGVLLRPVRDPAEAAVQVQFRGQSEQQRVAAEVAAEVAAQIAERRTELDRQQAEIERAREILRRDTAQEITRRARIMVAGALRQRHRETAISAVARKGVYLIIRVNAVIWLGDDAYLRVSVQNRGSAMYRIASVGLRAAARERAAEFVFPNAGLDHVAGVVLASSTEHGILVIPDAAPLMGQPVEIVFTAQGAPGEVIRMNISLVP